MILVCISIISIAKQVRFVFHDITVALSERRIDFPDYSRGIFV